MFKRLFWMSTGVGLTLWGRRKAIKTVETHVPARVIDVVTGTVKSLASDIADRQAEMKRDARLKDTIDTKGTVKGGASEPSNRAGARFS